MVDFFYCIYTSIKTKNKFLNKIRYYSLLRFIIRRISNTLLPLYFSFTQRNNNHQLTTNNKNKHIIVSLTSFPARIDNLWLVIETLLRQSYKPDKIILWLSKKQFYSIESLPSRLLKQQNRGLCIRLVDDDFRSHKKYLYAINEYPNNILVTADDDIFYHSNWLKLLIESHKLNPDSIICTYGHKILYNSNGEMKKYTEWEEAIIGDNNIFFGSGGGVLFPINSFYKDIYNINLALELCPLADDVWLNTMVRLNSKKITKNTSHNVLLPILNNTETALSRQNLNEGQNDIQINNVIKYYIKLLNVNPYKQLEE